MRCTAPELISDGRLGIRAVVGVQHTWGHRLRSTMQFARSCDPPRRERDHVVDLGAVSALAELADEPRADQRFAADLG
jgi:hypothetical protein